MKIGQFANLKSRTCPHCFRIFDNVKLSIFSNHVRWCDPNSRCDNGKYTTIKLDQKCGILEYHFKQCERCLDYYIFYGRKNTKEYQSSRFCSKSCSASIGALVRNEKYGYDGFGQSEHIRVCSKTHIIRKCFLCDFDLLLHVHHFDENSENNHPDNLFFLCPNHHSLIHTIRNKNKIKNEIIRKKNGLMV